MPLARRSASSCQSNANPAEGGSKAAGVLAILVQLSQGANAWLRWAYWIGRPCRESPAQISSVEPSKATDARTGHGPGWLRPSRRAARGQAGRRGRAQEAGADLPCGSASRRRRRRSAENRLRSSGRSDGTPGEAELDRCHRRQMDAGEAGGNGRRVIGDHEIARPQQPDKGRAPVMGDASRPHRRPEAWRPSDAGSLRGRQASLTSPGDPGDRPGRQGRRDRRDQLSGGLVRRFQLRGIGFRDGHGMKRRVHVAGIVGQDMDAGLDQLQVPDPAEMMEGRLARP